jgi:hypothetical protein
MPALLWGATGFRATGEAADFFLVITAGRQLDQARAFSPMEKCQDGRLGIVLVFRSSFSFLVSCFLFLVLETFLEERTRTKNEERRTIFFRRREAFFGL